MNNQKLIPELRFPEFKNEGEWLGEKLSIISEVIMGSSPSSVSYNENGIGLPLLQGNADIKNRFSAPRIYTTEITKECAIDDILLSVRAPVGTVAKSLHKACIGRGISALRALKPNSQEYLYQWLFSYEASWQKVSQGGTFDAVNSDDIRNLLVPTPKPQEQQKIASCLSSLDEVITAHSQKLEVLKDHKKGLMQNLFPQEGEKMPKYRFKEFENDGDWVEESIQKLIDKKTIVSHLDGNHGALYPKAEEFSTEGIPYISANDFISGLINFSKCKFLPVSKAKQFKKGVAKNGDILFAHNATVGPVAKLVTTFPYVILSTTATYFRSDNEKLINDFLLYALTSPSFVKQYTRVMSQSTRNQVPITTQREFTLHLPKPKEQQKIASCLTSLDAIITVQEEKIEQLKLHKKGLMQGLFPKIKE